MNENCIGERVAEIYRQHPNVHLSRENLAIVIEAYKAGYQAGLADEERAAQRVFDELVDAALNATAPKIDLMLFILNSLTAVCCYLKLLVV